MYSGDFLKTIAELHDYRGVPYTEIQRALNISRQTLYDLRKEHKRITNRVLKCAENTLPELLLRYPRLKPGGVHFLEYTEDTVTSPTPTPIQDQRKEFRILWERPPGVHPQPIDDREMRLRAKQARERQAWDRRGKERKPT